MRLFDYETIVPAKLVKTAKAQIFPSEWSVEEPTCLPLAVPRTIFTVLSCVLNVAKKREQRMSIPKEETLTFYFPRIDTSKCTFSSESLDAFLLDAPEVSFVPAFSEDLFMDNAFVSADLIASYFSTQHLLDDIFDSKNGWAYRKARTELYPNSVTGSFENNLNRAGDKLGEIHDVTRLLAVLGKEGTNHLFLDVASAPGAWSDYLLKTYNGTKGIGMSLMSAERGFQWYESLEGNASFRKYNGKDGSGSVYSPENVAGIATELETFSSDASSKASLVMADGGVLIPLSPLDNKHAENLQESVCSQLLFSEVLIGLSHLCIGGNFLTKVYDTCTRFTTDILFILYSAFENFSIVKPKRSRIVNAEKYVVCINYRGASEHTLRVLTALHTAWSTRSTAVVDICTVQTVFRPSLQPSVWQDEILGSTKADFREDAVIAPTSAIDAYASFRQLIFAMNTTLITKSRDALSAVVKKTYEVLEREKTGKTGNRRGKSTDYQGVHKKGFK